MVISLTQFAALSIISAIPLIFLPELPSLTIIIALLALATGALLTPWRIVKIVGLALLLFSWIIVSAKESVWQIEMLSEKSVQVTARIKQLSEDNKRAQIRIITADKRWIFPPIEASVTLPKKQLTLCAGQTWQLQLKLRPVHARLNEGEFDLQRYVLANHSALQGQVVAANLLDGSCSWRSRYMSFAQTAYKALPWQMILTALAFGERSAMTTEMTALLKETGTAHLMAISGMHIGLAAGFGWIAARALQLIMPAGWIGQIFPLICSLLVATGYTWLSGNHPPAQRAMLALILWSLIRIKGRNCHGWQIWTLCVAGLLLIDPLMILSESFWLSAVAVAALIAWYQWFPLPESWNRGIMRFPLKLIHLQVGMMFLMLPIQMWIFSGTSLSALPANMMAIPIVSLVTVPLILLALTLPVAPISTGLWWLADRSVACVIFLLQALPSGWLAIENDFKLLSFIPLVGLFLWRFAWWQTAPLTLIGCGCALILWRLTLPKPDWRIDMLDVGHGLAIVISKQGRAVIYDTGNRWLDSSAGERVIVPWLERKGLQPEEIILSHAHLDHTGGLASIQQRWPEITIRSALGNPQHLPCHQGERWQWQQLNFTVLWPLSSKTQGNNNDSCVIRIDDGHTSLLLTGDLELKAEMQLLLQKREALRSNIVQVPHHGSKSSSAAPVLRAIAGDVALASVSRYNAWRLPSRQVTERYQQNGYVWYDTAVEGQISVQITGNDWQISGMRTQLMPRWYHQWFGVPRYSR